MCFGSAYGTSRSYDTATHRTSRRAGGSKAWSKSSSGQAYTTRNARPVLPRGKRLCILSSGLGRNCIEHQYQNQKLISLKSVSAEEGRVETKWRTAE